MIKRMAAIDKERIEYGLLRQMDIQNAMYPSRVPVLIDPPTDLEFSRLVHDNFPALFKQAGSTGFAALSKWTTDYLKEKLRDCPVKVAETPFGNADSPLHDILFVKPHVRTVSGDQMIDLLMDDSKKNEGIVRYMQSQDNNFESEFAPLVEDALLTIPWAESVLQSSPEAVNLWIGKGDTTSRLHNDNYENIFVQLQGRKKIYLIPPGDAYALDEKFLIDATYVYDPKDPLKFHIQIDDEHEPIKVPGSATKDMLEQISQQYKRSRIMFPTVNPADSATFNPIFKGHCKVYKVVLEPGDMLYIPSLWYHQVEIEESSGLCISLNYWYPVSPLAPLWAKWDYIRVTSALLRGYHDNQYFD
ncbi:hypothetical protein TRICI_000658 [Trichomonascus ciferrii]|uniref:JmjC domain-containing protein n=1 Tax=Trichomonascus ciferrii TaxID=44093 RepID=A0A642VBV1_9ASCO|nr:hypothetical protein TRICI_000658 [Trichomonascus ciferrii]